MGNLSQLTYLLLSGNKLEGPIPESFGNLNKLISLGLSNNIGITNYNDVESFKKAPGLTGPIPESLGNLINLQYLYLEGNTLSGTIPDTLRNLKNLQALSLGWGSNFSGSMPVWLGELPNLKWLYIGWTNLTGTFPDLSRLSHLRDIVLHGNQLSGGLPEWLTRLTELREISIGDSELGGEIPESISNLTKLEGFYIQRSNIIGEIPSSLLSCTNLSVLDIKYMKLKEIPDFISQFQNLDSLIANNSSFENLPEFLNHPKRATLRIYAHNNHLNFEDIVKNFSGPNQHPFDTFTYANQTPKDSVTVLAMVPGQTQILYAQDNALHNLYQWQKQENGYWANIVGATASTYSATLTQGETEAYYRCKITNSWVTDLTLYSPVYHLKGVPPLSSLSDNPPTDAPAPTVTGTLNAPAEVAAVSDINYVRTFTPRNPVLDDAGFSLSSPVADLQVATQYIDGLGRPVQTVMRGESPEGKDIIQPIAYDAFGRVEKEYLPYTHNSSDPGKYQSNALKQQYDFYHAAGDQIADTDFPFAQKVFEPSPLNRVTAQAAPGENWAAGSGNEVQFSWRGNTIALDGEIRLWNIDETKLLPVTSATYAPNELWVTETTDEDEKKVWEYKDKLGQVVLKKVQLADAPDPAMIAHYTYTYYVYDDLQNLRFVIQPEGLKKIAEANWLVSAELKKQFCFSYLYDGRRRMIEKQVPGAEPVHMVYNQRDLLVLSQDGNQRALGEWSFTKYDGLNRPVLSGILKDSRTRGEMETAARADGVVMVEKREGGTSHMGYSNVAFPILTLSPETYYLTASYYDAYDFDYNGTADLESLVYERDKKG